MDSGNLYTETLEAPTYAELLSKLDDFMHDKLIVREDYFYNGIGSYGVHLVYIEL